MGANAVFSIVDIPMDILSAAQFVHLGGFYLLPKFDGEGSVETLKRAKQAGAITSMDILGVPQENMAEKILPCMPYLEYFMPNLEEAQMITGLSDIDEMCEFFMQAGAKNVCIRMGEQGALVRCSDPKNETRIRIPAYQVKVVDTSGCGDAWSGGFIAGLSKGLTIRVS